MRLGPPFLTFLQCTFYIPIYFTDKKTRRTKGDGKAARRTKKKPVADDVESPNNIQQNYNAMYQSRGVLSDGQSPGSTSMSPPSTYSDSTHSPPISNPANPLQPYYARGVPSG